MLRANCHTHVAWKVWVTVCLRHITVIRWFITDMHQATHNVLVIQCHDLQWSRSWSVCFSVCPLDSPFRTSDWADKLWRDSPPRSLSHLSTHCLGFNVLTKKKCHGLFGKFHTFTLLIIWIYLLLYCHWGFLQYTHLQREARLPSIHFPS